MRNKKEEREKENGVSRKIKTVKGTDLKDQTISQTF